MSQTLKVVRPKFDFNLMKEGATSPDRTVRKDIFQDYFERYEEFPSFLFDNEEVIDPRLLETMQDLANDPQSSERLQKALLKLRARLP